MAAMGNIAATAAIGTTMGAVAIPASTTAMGVAAASVFPPGGAKTAATCSSAVRAAPFIAAMPAATNGNGTCTNTTGNVGPTGSVVTTGRDGASGSTDSGGLTKSAVHAQT